MSFSPRSLGALRIPRAITVRRLSLALMALTASVAMVACSEATGEGTPTPTQPPATGTATGGGAGGDAPHGVDASKCEGVVPLVQAAFPGATLIEDVTAFEAGGGSLVAQGCRVMVVGDADELPPFVEVAQALRTAMEAYGWVEDTQYQADGPTGTQTVYQKGEEMALVAAGVAPKDPSVCPSDQIIGECLDSLEPDEIQVTGAVVVRVE